MNTVYPWQGTIRRQYAIGCAHCSAEDTVEIPSKTGAIRFWRNQGWHTVHGLWCCRDCGQKKKGGETLG